MEELYKRISGAVVREARLASARWNNMTEADDIEQDLWLWIMESPSIQKYLGSANDKQLKSALGQKADSICAQGNLDYDHFSGQYTYTPAEVRELLATYFGSDVSQISAEVMALAEEELSQAMISNILGGYITPDEKIDIELALAVLEESHPKYYILLTEVYAAGIEPEDRKVKTRAVDKLTTIMNRKRSQRVSYRHEGPGTKPKVTTNQEEI